MIQRLNRRLRLIFFHENTSKRDRVLSLSLFATFVIWTVLSYEHHDSWENFNRWIYVVFFGFVFIERIYRAAGFSKLDNNPSALMALVSSACSLITAIIFFGFTNSPLTISQELGADILRPIWLIFFASGLLGYLFDARKTERQKETVIEYMREQRSGDGVG